jgi:hypothetical protein
VGDPRCGFPQEFQSLSCQLRAKGRHACDVSAWPSEVGDESLLQGIVCDTHDDWGTRRCALGRAHARRAGDYDIDLESDQVGRKRRKPARILPRPSVLDGNVFVLDPAEFAETVAECIESGCEPSWRGAHQKEPDPRSFRPLRVAHERRRERGRGTEDEGPPVDHSIT